MAFENTQYTLWGLPHSLYTGKIRSYLIKKAIPFREIVPTHPDFKAVRAKVRLKVAPIIETPNGAALQDTTDMIDYFEAASAQPLMVPTTPVMKTLAHIVDAFGSEGMLPAAMHYRWSFRADQENFLRSEFGRGVIVSSDRETRRAAGQKFMEYFNNLLPGLGVSADTADAIECAYLDLLDALDIHLQIYPYLLGGRPSIADTGLMAPLFAHLGRDPVPATIMKNRAPNVYRWTERMNLPAIADGEFPDCPETYFSDDAIAPTLEPILRLIFKDWGPELLANTDCYNNWVTGLADAAPGTMISTTEDRAVHPTLGAIEFPLRDSIMRKASAPHALWHFDRALQCARDLTGEAKNQFEQLIVRTSGEVVMAITLAKPLTRRDYVLVLGQA